MVEKKIKYKGGLELNWINKHQSVYYEYDENGNPGEPIWVDKNDIRVSEPRILKHIEDFGDTSNLKEPLDNALIKGDNLLGLRTLVEEFKNRPEKNKVKCVYIDPPYNTGNDDFIYDDNLKHSEWLTMMRDRLLLIKKLMRNDGVIFISIDDNENHRLRLLCDEIFGPENFIANIVWKKRSGGGYTNALLSTNHEYVLVYAKNRINVVFNDKEKNINELKKKYNCEDEKGIYKRRDLRKSGSADLRVDRPTMFYEINAPDDSIIIPIRPKDKKEGRWCVGKNKFYELKDNNDIEFVKIKGHWKVYLKERPYKEEGVMKKEKYETIWDNVALNTQARNEIKNIFPEKENPFDYPKPIKLIKFILNIATNEGDLILDSFAGSGSTGQSIFEMNEITKIHRKFILIELQSKIAEEITKERLNRYILNKKNGFGFRYYQLGESLIKDNDMNWDLTYEEIAKALFFTFDFSFDNKINENTYYGHNEKATALCIVSKKLNILNKNQIEEFISKIKNKREKLVIYTNNGIAIKSNDLDDSIVIKKIPESILRKYKL